MSGPVLAAMDYLVPRVLLPENPDQLRRSRGKAAFLFFVRSHWLRMPPLLLTAHLTRKALMRLTHRREVRIDSDASASACSMRHFATCWVQEEMEKLTLTIDSVEELCANANSDGSFGLAVVASLSSAAA